MTKITASILTIIIVGLTALPAAAHTQDEYDQWVAEWAEQVFEDGALTMSALEELHEMQGKHPCIASYCAPPTVKKQSVTTAPSDRTYSAGVEQWRGLVESYFAAGDVAWAMRVMKCESKGDPDAKNPYSSASGLFQHLARYWDERSAKAGWGGANIFDPTANVAVAAWLFYSGGGAGHWVCR